MNAVRHGLPARREGVWLRRAGKEVALYDSDGGRVHLMNDAAAAIWDLCDGNTEPNEMTEAICELSGMPGMIVVDDVQSILNEFTKASLITWTEPDHPVPWPPELPGSGDLGSVRRPDRPEA